MHYLSLRELGSLIKSAIQSTLIDEYWVTAEIAQINCHYNSGHCYIELVEKKDDSVMAQMRATIWARDYRKITAAFLNLTGQELQTGMKVLVLARVTYHEVYGLSLNIKDIDPRYTLGEMALRRKQILEQLTREGIIDRNRKIILPPVMQNFAVISSLTAAGYRDFLSRLNNNSYGYRFSHKLFQAYVQGEKAEESIMGALRECMKFRDRFDAIVIIRGGGSTIDLHCFDSYLLAKEIALSPLPVLTGIGHEKDETVADRVANMRLITPTAVAEFLISRAKLFEDNIDTLKHRCIARTHELIHREKLTLKGFSENLSRHSRHYLQAVSSILSRSMYALQTHALSATRNPSLRLTTYEGRLKNAGDSLLKTNYQRLREFAQILKIHPKHMLLMQSRILENHGTKIHLLNPLNVLKRGYSLTLLKGKVLKDVNLVTKADIIDTRLHNGTITSTVEDIRKEKNSEQAEENYLFTGDRRA